uniref:Uncharacterized protein n=1 Tax=Solanum tuberosum TaxID=4113 RepID=M1D6M9_SOLTU
MVCFEWLVEFFLDWNYVLPSMQLRFAVHSGHQFEVNLATFCKMSVVDGYVYVYGF